MIYVELQQLEGGGEKSFQTMGFADLTQSQLQSLLPYPPTLIQRLQIFWKQADKSDFSSQNNFVFSKAKSNLYDSETLQNSREFLDSALQWC